MVEFALVIPIFLILLVALFDLGRAVFSYNTLTNAAREGARMAVVNQYKPSIIQRAQNASSMVEIDDPSVVVDFFQENLDGTPDKSKACPSRATGCLAVVSFEAWYYPITPIISNILFKNGVKFKAESILTVEYACPDVLTAIEAAKCPKQP